MHYIQMLTVIKVYNKSINAIKIIEEAIKVDP